MVCRKEVVSIGYLAPCKMWRVQGSSYIPNSNYSVKRCGVTLSGDSGLVACRLRGLGIECSGIFSHPGSDLLAQKVLEFLAHHLSDMDLGVMVKSCCESHLLVNTQGETIWFGDTSHVKESLASLKKENYSAKVVYVDLYPWLIPVTSRVLKTAEAGVYVLNFGHNKDLKSMLSIIEKVRGWHAGREIWIQVSAGKDSCIMQSMDCLLSKVDVAIITHGSQGLSISTQEDYVYKKALQVNLYKDASGAGAAISSQLCSYALNRTRRDFAELASLLAEAGAQQCSTLGSLDKRSFSLLNQYCESL